jgi:hypothetical protein
MVRALLTAAVLFVWAAPLSGCVTGEPTSVFIVGNAGFDDECTSEDDTFLLTGLVDVAVRTRYLVHPVVWNQLRRRSNHIGVDPNGVHFHTAEVSLRGVDGSVLSGPFDVPIAGFVQSAPDADSHGVGIVSVSAPVDGAPGSGEAHLTVRLFGTTNGQLDVSTGEWQYLLRFCTGCLQCAAADETSCFPGQDGWCY